MKKRNIVTIAMMVLCALAGQILFPAVEPLADLFESMFAKAEAKPVYQAYSLPESNLGPIANQGEWDYALRESDEYAVITAYRGTDSSVTVPLMLAGHDVVGIADGAFAGKSISAIDMHSNILFIGGDPFDGQKPLIRALNASYPLTWAAENGCSSVINADYDLVYDVIDYTDVPQGRLKKRGEDYVVFNALEGARLSVGSKFWFLDERGLQFFYQVTAQKNEDGAIIVSVKQPELKDAVKNYSAEGEIYITEDDFIPADGITIVHDGADNKEIVRRGSNTTFHIKGSLAKEANGKWTPELKFGDTTTLSGTWEAGSGQTKTTLADGSTYTSKNKSKIELDLTLQFVVRYKIEIVNGVEVAAEIVEDYIATAKNTFTASTSGTLKGPKTELYDHNAFERMMAKIPHVDEWANQELYEGWYEKYSLLCPYLIMLDPSVGNMSSDEFEDYMGRMFLDYRSKIFDMDTAFLKSQLYKGFDTADFVKQLGSVKIHCSLFFLEIGVETGFELKGTFTATFTYKSRTIKNYNGNEWTESKVKDDQWNGLTFDKNSLEVSGEAKAYVAIKASIGLLCLKFAETSLEGGVKLSVKLDELCLEICVDPYLELKVYAGVWAEWGNNKKIRGSKNEIYKKDLLDILTGRVGREDGFAFHIYFGGDPLPGYSGLTRKDRCPYHDSLCTVDFDTGNSIELPSVKVWKREAIPVKQEYELDDDPVLGSFLGWMEDTSKSTHWVFGETPVLASMTLHAVWENSITVMFETNGADDTIGSQRVVPGGKIVKPEDPTKGKHEGFTTSESDIFEYWYYLDNEGHKHRWDFNRDVLPSLGELPTRLFILYALWYSNIIDEPTEGTETVTYIGDPTEIDLADYANAGSTEDYFDLKYFPDGNDYYDTPFVRIERVKSGVINVSIPKTMDYTENKGTNNEHVIHDVEVLFDEGRAFCGHPTLRSVQFEGEREGLTTQNMFQGCTALEYVDFGNCYLKDGKVGDYMCSGCTSLKCVALPKGITTIGNYAFNGCGIRIADLGEGVTTLGEKAFANCTGLTELRIPASMKPYSNGSYPPFPSCSNLKTVSIAAPEIGWLLYDTGSTLDELIIEPTMTSIGSQSFSGSNGTKVKRVVIEDGGSMTTIPSSAFSGNDALQEVVLGDNITAIGDYSFQNCTNLTSIRWNENITSIGRCAFYNTGFAEVSIPDTVKTISSSAFQYCKMTELDLGEGVTILGEKAFANCTELTELRIPASMEPLNTGTSSAPFPSCSNLKTVSIAAPEIGWLLYGTGSTLDELIIEPTMTSIGSGSFNGSNGTKVKKVVIEDGGSMTTISRNAFSGNNTLQEVVLGDSITTIGDSAFYNCSSLHHVFTHGQIASITGNSFNGCPLVDVYTYGENDYLATYCAGKNNLTYHCAELPAYQLTANANGASFDDGQECVTAQTQWNGVLIIDEPSWEGHIFSGWYTDESCTKKLYSSLMPAHDLTIYAGWDIDCFNVVLELGNGSIDYPEEFRAAAGTRILADIIPVRQNRVFNGWYLDPGCKVPFSGIMPRSDVTLYAMWVKEARGEYSYSDGEATLVHLRLTEYDSSEVHIPAAVNDMPVTGIAKGAFTGENVTKLYLPATVTDIADGAFNGMDQLVTISVDAGNPAYKTVDKALVTRDGTTLIRWPIGRRETALTLSNAITTVAPYAFEGSGLLTVTAGASLIQIGDSAFANSAIQTFNMNDALEEIGASAFEDTPLNSVSWSDSLISIGDSAFAGTALTELELPVSLETLGERCFNGCEELMYVVAYENLTTIGANCFEDTDFMLMLYGPIDDCAIKEYADTYRHYYNQFILTLSSGSHTWQMIQQAGSQLDLPQNPETAENCAFTGWYTDESCIQAWDSGMTMPQAHLTLYAGMAVIYQYETICDEEENVLGLRLTSYNGSEDVVTIPETIGGVPVIAISAGCFVDPLVQLNIPACVEEIAEGAFPIHDGLALICPPGSVADTFAAGHGIAIARPVYTLAFQTNGGALLPVIEASQGEAILLPVPNRSGCVFLGWHTDAELEDEVVENYVIPAGDSILYAEWQVEDETLAEVSFTWEEVDGQIIVTGLAEGVTELVIPVQLHGLPVTEIEAYAFAYEADLERVVIPDSVTNIPESAFMYCTSLESVTLGASVERLSEGCFAECESLESIVLPDGLKYIDDEAFRGTSLGSITLNSGLLKVESNAFDSCEFLTAFEVAEGNPYYYAVDGVLFDSAEDMLVRYPVARSAVSYSVPDGIYVIGEYAFAGADALKTIELPETIWSLGDGAFAGCNRLTSMPTLTSSYLTKIPEDCFAGCKALTDIIIPENITTIESWAFASCDLSRAVVPSSVTSIGMCAFMGTDLVIEGTTGTAAEDYADENGLLFVDPNVTVLPESITLSYETLEMSRGESIQLTATIQPETSTMIEVYWSSSDDSVAVVSDDGLVEAISGGTATIWAVTRNDLIAMCEVVVDSAVKIESIRFSQRRLVLQEGDIITLQTIIQPIYATDCDLTWESSDETVAYVDGSGMLTAVSAGTTVIKVETTNHLIANCEITVEHPWLDTTYVWSDDDSTVTATRICFYSDEHIESETVNVAVEVIKDATCEENGETQYTATFENAAFIEQIKTFENIPALGHDWGEPTYEWAENNSSVTATRVCAHDTEHIETETVPVTAQITLAATCEAMGQTTYTSGEFDNEAFAVQSKTLTDVPALGHEWSNPTYEWAENNSSMTATRVCAHDAEHIETETVPVTAQITTAATCEAMGQTTYTSGEFENEAFAVQSKTLTDVPALGHDWGDPTYKWAENNSSVTATRVCTHDAEHIETETVPVTAQITTAATCEAMGQTTYTSGELENEAFAVQSKTLTDVPALGHEWGDPTYEWAENNSSVTATRVCAHDAEHIETETVSVTFALASAPTETQPGSTTYTAQFVNKCFETQTITLEDIPSLSELNVLRLPAMLDQIDAEAFSGLACEAILVPEGVTSIGAKAFANCSQLIYVKLPAGLTYIAEDAFEGSENVRIEWGE